MRRFERCESGAGGRHMIRVLTIEREYGSGGAEIAAALAQRLGWKLWDQALTNEIARQMECDCRVVEEREERRDPLFHRLLMAFMRGSHEGSLNAPRLKLADADCIREVTEQVVKEAAQCGGCVIVGRGSAYYLDDRHDAFHVFIYAPFAEKVKRLRAEGKSERPCSLPKPSTAIAPPSSSNISTSIGPTAIAST